MVGQGRMLPPILHKKRLHALRFVVVQAVMRTLKFCEPEAVTPDVPFDRK